MDVSWRTVDVDGADVRVMEAGRPDGHVLLFLHGWGLSPRTYADGISRVTAAGVRVIAPALPGFAGSDGPRLREIDMATYAARISRLLEVLGVDEPVFLVGHSFGGGVAIQLADTHPELVRSLTLINTVGGAPGKRQGLVDASWLRWMAGCVGELDPKDLVRSAPAMLRDFVPNLLRKPVTLALTARLALTADLAATAARLVARGMPVLFVWGDADRLILPGPLSEVVGSLPHEVVQGRHGWLLSDPVEFGSLLSDALVVHAMLERHERLDGSPRGQTVVLPAGASLADLLPQRPQRDLARSRP